MVTKYSDFKEPEAMTVNDVMVEYGVKVNSNIDIALKANQGIDAITFFETARVIGYSKEDMAKVLGTSVKTFTRYQKENKKLGPLRSELLLKILTLFQKGTGVFGQLSSFKMWLNKPAFGLGNQTPFSFLYTSTGIDLVLDEVIRIEHGDLA